jgi:glutamate racemase
VHSHAYAAACSALGLHALEKACPLLVPLVEEGWTNHPVTDQVIGIYLDELLGAAKAEGMDPDTLVLGCTHYPLLRPLIERAVPAGIKVIDSAESAADAAVLLIHDKAETVSDCTALSGGASRVSPTAQVRCFATDSVDKFERLGSRFLGRPVGNVELVDLGG